MSKTKEIDILEKEVEKNINTLRNIERQILITEKEIELIKIMIDVVEEVKKQYG